MTPPSVEALPRLRTNEGSGYERSRVKPPVRTEYWPLIGQGWQILASDWPTSSVLRNCHDTKEEVFLVSKSQVKSKSQMVQK